MLDFIIKYLFVYSNCIYLYYKILNHPLGSHQKKVVIPLLTIFLTFTATLCKVFASSCSLIFPIILLWTISNFHFHSPKLAFVTTLLSFGISYGILGLSSLTIVAILTIMGHPFSLLPMCINVLLSGLLQTRIVISIFHLRRLRKGMPYLHNSSILNAGILIGIFILVSAVFIQTHIEISRFFKAGLILFIEILLFLLLHWWQSQLTKAYRKRLAQMELESLRTELEQKSILLKKLEAQNEEMGRLIHKDNKLIPAMEHAVSTYLTSDFTDLALQQAQGEALLIDLKELSAARQGILSTFTPAATPKYETGIPSLDAILVYMYQKAQSNGIRFYATATQESLAKCPTKLTNEKLVHILSDLLENAIIATKSSSDKQIQLQIYLANGIFTIEIADTGLSFEPATLISFGLEKASTHLKDGGSGIGLLDIWKIKEEVKASIHIHEYETGTPFSKKIFISFDNRNKYVIHTWRDKELAPLVNRGDLVLLSQNQQTA